MNEEEKVEKREKEMDYMELRAEKHRKGLEARRKSAEEAKK